MKQIINKISIKWVFLFAFIFIAIPSVFCQPGPPPPPFGVPIDGLSGILIMAAGAFFGKKYLDKK